MEDPSTYFKRPIIGKIVTRSLFGEAPVTYEVIAIIDDLTRGKTYVCNQWYKEYKHVPQLLAELLVERFEPK